jgi:hypothetical protein
MLTWRTSTSKIRSVGGLCSAVALIASSACSWHSMVFGEVQCLQLSGWACCCFCAASIALVSDGLTAADTWYLFHRTAGLLLAALRTCILAIFFL